MTSIAATSRLRRAFACWPSRLGLAALIALGVSWGSEALADPADAPVLRIHDAEP